MGFDKLANNRGNVNRPALSLLLIEFNGLRTAARKFVELLFQDDPYHSKLCCVASTSRVPAGGQPSLPSATVSSNILTCPCGAVLGFAACIQQLLSRSLFRDVIFPDQHLVTQQIRLMNCLRLSGDGV